MSKFIVVVFDDEKAAYEGSKALMDLDRDGNIAVFGGAVITKDSDGNVGLKEAIDNGPVKTAAGMVIGSLVGAIGGFTGMAIGAPAGAAVATMAATTAGGTLVGWYSDLRSAGVDAQFIEDVGALMTPGKSALIAEISEGWTTPLNASMEELGGTVFRRYRLDVEDAQLERDLQAAKQELEELKSEWDHAVGDAKNDLNARVTQAKERVDTLLSSAGQKLNSLKEEADTRIGKINAQIEKASGAAKESLERSRDQLQKEYESRSAKLAEAAKLTKEALT